MEGAVATLAAEVAEVDVGQCVHAAGDAHHARAGGGEQPGRQATGQGEVPEVVDAELGLEAVGCGAVGECHDAGVVDQQVQPLVVVVLGEGVRRVISINGEDATGVDLGWRDTFEVIGGGEIVVAMKFTDYTDDTYMYMLHCHVVQHEDEGMTAALMVTAS